MKKFVFAMLSALVLFSSCVKMDDFQLLSVDGVKMRSMSRINVNITAANSSRLNVKLLSADLNVERNGEPLLAMMVKDQVELPKRATSSLEIPVVMQVKNMFSAMAVLANVEQVKDQLTVSGRVKVKAGLGKKTFEIKQMPLSQFMSRFGVDINQLKQSINE